ncbi:MFS transporter [Corynebacterium sp. NML120713]|uniref:MFS transporter n=1 Tax=Corynebacterium sp. NML120713 TaxID=1906332 RepID=UPI0008FBB4ED|nr:MFS transporter [Corynebacterium sp. NML120713]
MAATEGHIQSAGKIPARHLMVIIGALLVEVAFSITLTGLSFFTPAVLGDFPGTRAGAFMIYFTLYGFASAASMPVAGMLIDRIKAPGLLVLGGLIAAGGLVVFSAAQSLWWFYAAGIVIGIGVGLSLQYVPIVVINRWFVAKRGTVLGIVLAGTGVGGVILGVVVPILLRTVGWRTSMVIMAVAMVVLTTGPALFLIRSNPEDLGLRPYGAEVAPADEVTTKTGYEPGMTQREAFGSIWFYVLAASLLLLGAIYGMTQHFVNYLSDKPWGVELRPEEISTIIITATICLIVFKPFLGWFIDKVGLERALWIVLLIAAGATAAWAYMTTLLPYVFFVIFIFLGTASGTVAPPLIAEHSFGQKEFSKIWGTLGMAYPIGLSIGAAVWGWVKDYFGSYGYGFVSVPVFTLLVLLGVSATFRGARKLWVPEAQQLA